jgi:hypothetical protein
MASQFNWKASFSLQNVRLAINSISVEGMQIVPHPKSNESPKVQVTYRFSTPDRVANIEKQTKETMERFLACSDVNTALYGLDVRDAIEEFDVKLDNWAELSMQGKNPPSKMTFNMRQHAIWNAEFVESAWNWYRKVAEHKDAEVICRILQLLRHSMIEDDEYDRFSKIWRAFNAFYNHLAGGRSAREKSRIGYFARSLVETNSKWLPVVMQEYWTPKSNIETHRDLLLAHNGWDSVMGCLAKQGFIGDRGTNHSDNLRAAVFAKDLGGTLLSSLLCLYCERNRVMHGEVISDSERDLLYVCASFLQRIVAIGLNEFYFIPIKESA